MRKYWLEDFKSKDNYLKFIEYMLKESDAFSLVYFRYEKGEKIKANVKEVKELLRPYVIKSWRGNEWASMETKNEFGHIYQITMYRALSEAIAGLSKANCVFDWDYPKYPMDLCFFKDGFCWFASCAHEQYAFLYSDRDDILSNLEQLGTNLVFYEKVDRSALFFDKHAVVHQSKSSDDSQSGDGSLIDKA